VIELSVVIPAHNEAFSIERLVDDLASSVVPLARSAEVIVVDDASTDETPAILDGLAAKHDWLVVEHARHNAGHGPSVARGLRRAQGEWIFQIDSDGQFVLAEFARLWNVRNGKDLILGVRADRNDPRHRIILSSLVRRACSLLAGRTLRDPNVPFRLLSRKLLDDVLTLLPPVPLAPSILTAVAACRRGFVIDEQTVTHLARATGRSSLRHVRLVGFSARGLVQLVVFSLALGRRPAKTTRRP
jgi:dolichol-phosphate mannosyltransferase